MSRPSLKPLEIDPDVIHLQKLLLANGYYEGRLAVTGLFDQVTALNVEVFQLQHLDKDGRPLTPNGVVGRKTWWALENPSGLAQRSFLGAFVPEGLTEGRRRLIELLIEEHAKPVHEYPDGSNRSPDIDHYWGGTGVIGQPWCCAFVSWALFTVLDNYPIGDRHHIGVQNMWRDAKRLGFEVPEPKPGDVFIQIKSGGKGHTGFVIGVSEDETSIYTAEGNCGNRLKFGRRDISSIQHFVDPLQDGQSLTFDRGDPGTDADAVDDASDR